MDKEDIELLLKIARDLVIGGFIITVFLTLGGAAFPEHDLGFTAIIWGMLSFFYMYGIFTSSIIKVKEENLFIMVTVLNVFLTLTALALSIIFFKDFNWIIFIPSVISYTLTFLFSILTWYLHLEGKGPKNLTWSI